MSEDTEAEVQRTLGRIEGTLSGLDEKITRMSTAVDALGPRVSSLEKWRAWTAGVAAAIGALIGWSSKH